MSMVAAPAGAANQIGERAIRLDQPLTDAEVARIGALKDWPWVDVSVERAGNDEALASLSALPGLRRLFIRGGGVTITTLRPLSDMDSLLTLDIGPLRIASKEPVSLAPISSCSELVTLKVAVPLATNVSAIGHCSKLRVLDLDFSQVDSLNFLAFTPLIEKLGLSGATHTFRSYEPVSRLARLRELSIQQNPQATDKNLAVLKRLTGLREISLSSCRELTSLDFLSGSPGLRVVNAGGCHSLVNISALARMSFLEDVDLGRAKITDLAPLAGKDYLTKLDIGDTAVTDLTPLAGSRHLRSLILSNSAVTNLSVLSDMRMLSYLNLSGTGVADLSPLKGCTQLHSLTLSGTAVTDLSALAGLTELKLLNLADTAVADLTPLHGLLELEQLTIPATVGEERIARLRVHLPNTKIVVR
ncbi:MAG: leucine-rich repeat domain-containing protein [Verrucomicrobiota bacterium]